MGRRSPTHQRSQHGSPGKTRRSSAALKPKRTAGGTAPAPAKKSARRGPVDPPEVKRWRRLWWAFIATALVPVVYMFVPGWFIDGWQPDPQLTRIGLAIEFGAFAAALYIDFAIIRKIRKQAAAKVSSKGDKE